MLPPAPFPPTGSRDGPHDFGREEDGDRYRRPFDDDGDDDGDVLPGFGPPPFPPPFPPPGRYTRPFPDDGFDRQPYRPGPPPPFPPPPARRFERAGGECGWIGRRAERTGSLYWWHRFDECRAHGYDIFSGDR